MTAINHFVGTPVFRALASMLTTLVLALAVASVFLGSRALIERERAACVRAMLPQVAQTQRGMFKMADVEALCQSSEEASVN